MAITPMALVWANRTLSGIQKAILLKLADHGNDQGESIFPSITALSETTGFHRSTVLRTIEDLVELGILKKKKRRKADGTYTSNNYKIVLSKLSTNPVDNPVVKKAPSRTKRPGGSSRERQGVVAESDTKHKHETLNNETLNVMSANAVDEGSDIRDQLTKIGVVPPDIKRWVARWGEDILYHELAILRQQKSPQIKNMGAALRAALCRRENK